MHSFCLRSIHSYNLDMSNHPHISGHLSTVKQFSAFFKTVNSCFAKGKADPMITPAPAYLEMGETDAERQKAYRDFVEELINNHDLLPRKHQILFYVGDPAWVNKMLITLRKAMKEKRKQWLQSYKEQFG
jgi:hypothetical protein